MNSSDDDFSDHDSGVDLGDESLSPDTEGMAKRTRLKKVNNGKQGASGGYAWEDEYQRTWDIVKNDEDGEQSLENLVQQMIESRKKKIMRNPATPFQRGIIRTLIVVIDGSLAMLEKDLRPTRFSAMLSYLSEFINEFFDQNPISQLGIVMMRNGMAHLVSEVSGSPSYHLDKLKNLRSRQHNRFEPKGDPSLQNALELSRSLLTSNFQGITSTSNKNSKEILIIFGALFTSDPGDIHKTIDALVKESIKVKVIGLSAQVAICQEIVRRTNFATSPRGKLVAETGNFYGVIMNEAHFKELLMNCMIRQIKYSKTKPQIFKVRQVQSVTNAHNVTAKCAIFQQLVPFVDLCSFFPRIWHDLTTILYLLSPLKRFQSPMNTKTDFVMDVYSSFQKD
ncbi:uncharacterized protein CXQ87_004474 [Candidozyma duobushaemuli]|uniref:VWFA domain-containing protein n=1 Tax=Candidozyma duobushaemuli TaxID=1231522 RepID=A0A2V1AH67_9ASCO|nr:uncharacterized protein CXQ87_004474 [[Candida] duobushaemulonis]PVH16916.1 hypothetical protein CXQ87_004474 [[Candida] duobushaemulonis]